jgi:tetratricopeptide (TPR) repeat protein
VAESSSSTYERAYCLYSLNREDDALKILMPSGATPDDMRGMLLAAQIFYRQGEYAKAAESFMRAEKAGEPSAELSTNILAALVSAGKA